MWGLLVSMRAQSLRKGIGGRVSSVQFSAVDRKMSGEETSIRASNVLKFPEAFLIGTASSSYQTEGAWNIDGKGESIWDYIVHTQPNKVQDGSNADLACNSYHMYKQDVQIIKDIGFDFYRFSISWPRILPTGEAHNLNELGVKYYNNLIDELLDKNIQPMVTIYHWDLPRRLQEIGGWLNPLIAGYFEDYARTLFRLFGDRVKWWVTINEPEMVAHGYGNASFAPCINLFGFGEYLAAHHMLIAHARAYRAYDSDFRATQKGKVTIGLNMMYHWPKTHSKEDKAAAERAMQFQLGWFADPIFGKTGDYPETMRSYLDKASNEEGRAKSKLPKFTPEEVALVRGSCDFFGYQHYTSTQVADDPDVVPEPWYTHKDLQVSYHSSSTWKSSSISWLKVVPEGFRHALQWIKTRYGNPTVMVTECGYGDYEENDSLNDKARIEYFNTYLKELLKAVHVDGCDVIGFAAWSILDNFEWFDGFRSKFGLVKVDFSDSERKRTLKKSASYFKELLIRRELCD